MISSRITRRRIFVRPSSSWKVSVSSVCRVIAAAGARVCTTGGSSDGFEAEVAADTVLVVGGDVLVVVEARGVSYMVLRFRDFYGSFALVYTDDIHGDQGRLET